MIDNFFYLIVSILILIFSTLFKIEKNNRTFYIIYIYNFIIIIIYVINNIIIDFINIIIYFILNIMI